MYWFKFHICLNYTFRMLFEVKTSLYWDGISHKIFTSPAKFSWRVGDRIANILQKNKNLSCSCICEKTCRLGHAFKNATKLLPPSSFYPLNPSRDQNRISHCQHRCIIRHTGDENKDNHQQSDFVFMHHQILKTDIKGTDAVSKENLLSELGTE